MDVSMNDTQSMDKWIIEMVEKGSVGEYTAQILDLKGKVHIAYFDHSTGNLKHAQLGPDGYIIDIVDQDGTVGQYLSMVRDEMGKFYISYRDQGKNRLKIAVFDGVKWNNEVVDNAPFASLDTSICVDAHGKIYISYYNFHKGHLKLASKYKDQWNIEIVDGGQKESNAIGGFSSAKVDSLGRVHISYVDSVNGLLKYAFKENEAWHIEIADDSEFVGNFTSLALDGQANPYISYTVDKRPNKPDLWLARKVDGKWVNELVDTAEIVGNYSSIMIDHHYNIYISYSAMKKLKLAKQIHGLWSFEVVDPEGTITYTSLSMDTKGILHIAYQDKDRGVKYAHKEGGPV